jgi:hypothetical protein
MRNGLGELLGWCHESECLEWPAIEAAGDAGQLVGPACSDAVIALDVQHVGVIDQRVLPGFAWRGEFVTTSSGFPGESRGPV